MRFIFCDTNPKIVEAWHRLASVSRLAAAIREKHTLEIVEGDILKQKCDAVVSPANSFGFMDGGIDAHYTNVFGPQLQLNAQDTIKYSFGGELLIGQAFVMITHNREIPYCIIAPTMRVPMDVQGTVNAYLAARAAVKAVIGPDERCSAVIETIAMPGMATGCGHLDPSIAAAQMLAGVWHALEPQPFPASWYEESKRHTYLSVGRVE